MKPTPRTESDAAGDKRRALRHAADRTRRLAEAEQARNTAIRLAHQLGASLREIAEATGIPHVTVGRIVNKEE
jgi:DNA invertase Pin-like site-specific DNA recombinase